MRLTAPSRREWAVFALFLAIFSAVYLPVLRAEYGVEDDYVDFAAEVSNLPASLTDEFGREITPGRAWRRHIAEGRPLQGLAAYLAYGMASELEHHRYVRFAGILGIALLAWSLYRVLAGAGHHRLGAFCVAAVACSALPFQVWVYWASTATYPLAAALSGFAFLLADRASPHTHRNPERKWWSAAGAGATLLAALAIYQPAAMFYWVFAAAVLPTPNRAPGDLFRKLRRHCAIAAPALAASYGLAVLGLTLYPRHLDRMALVSDLPGQIEWFFLRVFHLAANFALPSPSWPFLPDLDPPEVLESADRIVGWAFFLVVSWGLVLYFRTAGGKARWRYGAAIFLLAAAFLPALVMEQGLLKYRTLAAPSALIVLYAYFGAQGFARAFRRRSLPGPALAVAALAGLLSAAYQVRVFLVEPQVREMEILRGELTGRDFSGARRIVLLQPTPLHTLAPFRHLEFGRPSSAWELPARAMVFLTLRETAPARAHLPIVRVPGDAPEPTPGPGDLVVDLKFLSRAPR